MVLCDIYDLNRLACVAEGVEYRVTVNMVQSHSWKEAAIKSKSNHG